MAKRPLNSAYPEKLVTLGDHLRKRRLDLGLFQRDVAMTIGVDTTTVNNWENGRSEPEFRFIPRIIEFLGYEPPLAFPKTDGERITEYRYRMGISQEDLARQIRIDPGTLSRVEKGRGRCFPVTIGKVAAFFERPGDGEFRKPREPP